jgi:hypothetical protein
MGSNSMENIAKFYAKLCCMICYLDIYCPKNIMTTQNPFEAILE